MAGDSERTEWGGVISSTNNAWVQLAVRLHRAKVRYQHRKILIEGEHAVSEAIAAQWPIEICFATNRWAEAHSEQVIKIRSVCKLQVVTDGVLAKIASTDTPDGLVAIGCMSPPNPRMAIPQLGIAMDRLQDPGNLGTLIRSAIACGADGIYVGEGSVDPCSPKVMRSTAGQWFRNPPTHVSLSKWLSECRGAGVTVLAAAAGGVPYWDLDLTQPTLFLIGNEGAGISPELIQMSDGIISVPMANNVESLNAAMTGTLLLYEAFRQRRQG